METQALLGTATASNSTSTRRRASSSSILGGGGQRLPSRYARVWKISGVAVCVGLLLVLWALPPPAGLTPNAMHLLAVFLSVIAALLLTDLKISVIVTLALLLLTFTRSFQCVTKNGLKVACNLCPLTKNSDPDNPLQCEGYKDAFSMALSGFSLQLSWLVLCSFQIGHAVEATGLGRRISLVMIKYLGGSLIGLGYAVFGSELLLGPFLPSNTARGAGIVMPIVSSLSKVLGSNPITSPEIGRFLVLCGSHSNLLISSIFLTSTVANPLIGDYAEDVFDIDFDFFKWSLGSIVPGLVLFVILPPILLMITGATEYDGAAVQADVKRELRSMGPLTWNEMLLLGVISGCLSLWISDMFPESLVAMTGLAVLLCTGALTWDEVVKNAQAWDSFFWLSGMVLMAEQLSAFGLTQWIGVRCAELFEDANDPVLAALGLSILYFLSSYLFSSITGHIVAFVKPMMEAGKALQTPPFLLTSLLAYFSALSACLTNYSSGPPVVYFSKAFFSQTKWFAIGLVVAIIHIGVYFTVGLAWFKILGWY